MTGEFVTEVGSFLFFALEDGSTLSWLAEGVDTIRRRFLELAWICAEGVAISASKSMTARARFRVVTMLERAGVFGAGVGGNRSVSGYWRAAGAAGCKAVFADLRILENMRRVFDRQYQFSVQFLSWEKENAVHCCEVEK